MATEHDWNERTLVEDPALKLLQVLGYTVLSAKEVSLEREGSRSVILTGRLLACIKRLNPWISDENAARVVRAVTNVDATGLIEANETMHTLISRGMSMQQADAKGRMVNRTARLLDFETPHVNDLVVARQFRVVRDAGVFQSNDAKDEHRDGLGIFDIAVFVNGLLLAVIECKSPFLKSVDPIASAVAQLERYQELGVYQGRGVPQAFSTVQVLVAACRERAVYGSVGAPGEFFAPFPETYPQGLAYLEGLVGQTPTMQDVLLYSVLAPENLLEFTRQYVVFEVENGRTIKKLARHQQRIAVDLTIKRIQGNPLPSAEPRSPSHATNQVQGSRWHLETDLRGGVIWHTQGSGKSLTMVWLAQKLRQASLGLANPTVVVVTDRTNLDTQIARTFHRVGFAMPKRAGTISEARRLLKGAVGLTLMTTVQKFQDLGVHTETLNDSSNIFVMVDEAHRTQYGELAAKMRHALPNATFIAFTGTPIDRQDRSTIRSFGPYIHKYTMEESVRDGATVPIFYEGRDLERLGVIGKTVDVLFERFFADHTSEERERIKSKYATAEEIAGAPNRIREIVLDLVQHFEQAIAPNGFKGQVVAVNREAAARYKEEIERIDGPSTEVIFTSQPDDPAHLMKHRMTKAQQEAIIEGFKKTEDPKLLIVVDMLLTGFDAPREQVLYLDKNLREHSLLQAIARVNRTAPNKSEGFVVDYYGVTEHLQEALEIFSPEDLNPKRVLLPTTDELPRLEARHRRTMTFFAGKSRDDLEALLHAIEPADVRVEFDLAFRQFAQSMNRMLPDARALVFSNDLRWLGQVRDAARQRFRDNTMDWTGIAEKVKGLIGEYIIASGVKSLVGPVSIFSRDFDEAVARLSSPDAQASEMAHATRHEISVRYNENPVFYESLRQRLEDIIEQRRANRLSAAEQLTKLNAVVNELRTDGNQAQQLQLSNGGFALYKLLEQRAGLPTSQAENLAQILEKTLTERIVIDWTKKEDVQRDMRRAMRRELLGAGLAREGVEVMLNGLMQVAKSNPGFVR